jgi:hypothetical protein
MATPTTKTTSRTYHPRLKRTAAGRRRPFRFQGEKPNDRDLQILQWVDLSGWLSEEQLLMVLPPEIPAHLAALGRVPTGKGLSRRLQQLFIHNSVFEVSHWFDQ